MPAPDAGERWVKGKLDLILEIQVGSRQLGEQLRQIGEGELSLDQLTKRFICGQLSYRSRTRNRKLAARSPRSIRRFRICCVVHGPSGLAVTPRMCT